MLTKLFFFVVVVVHPLYMPQIFFHCKFINVCEGLISCVNMVLAKKSLIRGNDDDDDFIVGSSY